MANELSVTTRVVFAKSPLPSIEAGSATAVSITVAGTIYKENIQTVGFAAEELLDRTDITTNGWCYMKNLDATNFVSVRAATGAANLIRLNAGESAVFRMTQGITPYVIADTAAVKLHYILFNN